MAVRTLSPAVQDYAKAIYALESREGAAVTMNRLADRLGVTSASASGMVKKLAEPGLVDHAPYRSVQLTPPGERLALEVLRRHRLLELFLAKLLDMPWDRVHDEAEILEHALSAQLEEIIAAKLGDPTRDPQPGVTPTRRQGHVRARVGFRPGDAALPRRPGDRPRQHLESRRAPAVRRAAARALLQGDAPDRWRPGQRHASGGRPMNLVADDATKLTG